MARRIMTLTIQIDLDEDLCKASPITDPEGHTDLDDVIDSLRTGLSDGIHVAFAGYDPIIAIPVFTTDHILGAW